MHMGSELVSVPVAVGLMAASGAGIAFASVGARRDVDEARVPLLGVLGALVFAAQMVNFPILPGTSGHFLGAALLAIVLGPHAAALGMSAVVIVQCFVYQDGGLLALGANLLNMAIVGPYAAYGAFRLVTRGAGPVGPARLYAGAFAAAFAATVAGAVLVPVEVSIAGASSVPFRVFAGWMGAVHAVIGLAEGAITFAVLVALRRMRPGIVPLVRASGSGIPAAAALASILAAAIVTGGFLSLAASERPDGLESTLASLSVVRGDAENRAADGADAAVASIAPFAGYTRPGGGWYWTSVAGVLGVVLMAGLATAVARALRKGASSGSA